MKVLSQQSSYHFLCSFLNCIVYFINVELYEFFVIDIYSLLDISLANIFSHLVDGLFILLLVPFIVKSFSVWCSPTCLFFHRFSLLGATCHPYFSMLFLTSFLPLSSSNLPFFVHIIFETVCLFQPLNSGIQSCIGVICSQVYLSSVLPQV